ncbi:MAG: Lrp/AsnC family transcriptional regulator [Chloroflexota bacterium]|nr:MAG: Lrp/AsnC family transcriptional regulator [Chloroflexota bacterium]
MRATIEIDSLDRRIIALLQGDGRMPNTKIASQLGVSEGTVRKRIERLFEEEIIRVTAIVDPAKLGYDIVAFIAIESDLTKVDDLAERLAGLREVRYVAHATGTFDILAEVVVRSPQDLHDLVTKTIATMDGVRRTETSIVPKIAKKSLDYRLISE